MIMSQYADESGDVHSAGNEGPNNGINAPAIGWQNVAQRALAQLYGTQ